ncbi:MAG: tRNA (adenosine(37)-N6)-dimethylallyltransferase MiaA [Desulfotignum sp.]|nr:tRNA (adenosine(37)-N6)-dimethylallyltransferase MiaA [Desulfotignum sp.]MCF8086888.1 tRNA (adenosine(37)-N6)-dimethylallyltransferase MiaA [Desulfotignum sp.]MCF8136809.1 tRNA (adenosine(37)-N6)-dimethylallyltransferase MiaA [Desulfotignum sp.]
MKKIITICGPTGIGKTGFAIFLAKAVNGEIIGADSMQIYKYMDIGTAKPDASELAQANHHLVDFLDPARDFDAGQYAQLADRAVDTIVQKNRTPIVAGGTGLYIRSLLYGLFRSQPVCQDTLAELTQTLEKKGSPYLHHQLESCDPMAAQRIHPHDGFRIIRALEVFQTTGIPISESQTQQSFTHPRYRSLTLGLYMDRHDLYHRIEQRVDRMMAQGFLSEVRNLVNNGYHLNLKSMQSIGYRHMGKVINHELDIETAVSLLKRDTRRYAKRQFTWFKKEPGIVWIAPSQKNRAVALVKDFLTSL